MQFIYQIFIMCLCTFIGVMHAIPNPVALPHPEPEMTIQRRQIPMQGGPVSSWPHCCRSNPGTGGTICCNNTMAQWSPAGDNQFDCTKYTLGTYTAYNISCFAQNCTGQGITPRPVTIQWPSYQVM